MKETLEEEMTVARMDLALQLQASTIDQATHDAADADLEAYLTTMTANVNSRGACPVLQRFNTDGYPVDGANPRSVLRADTVWDASIPSVGFSPVTLTPPVGSGLTYNDLLPGSVTSCDVSCSCSKLDTIAEATYASRFTTMQTDLIARLDRNSGRLGAQKARKLELMREIVTNSQELYDFIIDLSTGLQPLEDPEHAVLDDVIAVYVDGPLAYGVDGQPNAADSLLKRTTILELDQDADASAMGVLAQRCQVCAQAVHGAAVEPFHCDVCCIFLPICTLRNAMAGPQACIHACRAASRRSTTFEHQSTLYQRSSASTHTWQQTPMTYAL